MGGATRGDWIRFRHAVSAGCHLIGGLSAIVWPIVFGSREDGITWTRRTAAVYAITDRLSARLAKAHYRIRRGEQLDAQPVQFVASKTIFIFTGLLLVSVNIVVLEQDEAKPYDIDNLSDIGFNLAKRMNRVPLLRGMQFGYVVMPMIVGKNPDSESLLYAASAPSRWRFGLIKFPIVVDLTRCQVAFFEGYAKLGGAIWPSIQKIVTSHIEPVVDEECSCKITQDQ